jgi:hypothetical protein
VAKVLISKLNKKSGKHKPSAVVQKRLRTKTGKFIEVVTLDSDSPTFGNDLKYAFQKNVSKVRRENKKRFGSADRVSGKY